MHVPYKGAAQAATDMLAGSVQIMFQFYGFTVPNAKTGKTRALASTGARRTEAMLDLPTLNESGMPGFTAATWYGLSGPAQLPRPIIERLNREAGELLGLASMRTQLVAQDLLLIPGKAEELTVRVKAEIPLFAKVARDAGIEQE